MPVEGKSKTVMVVDTPDIRIQRLDICQLKIQTWIDLSSCAHDCDALQQASWACVFHGGVGEQCRARASSRCRARATVSGRGRARGRRRYMLNVGLGSGLGCPNLSPPTFLPIFPPTLYMCDGDREKRASGGRQHGHTDNLQLPHPTADEWRRRL